ncbi:MAG: ABC transporter substrate-binding protein [Proteobacteria bacterium]|nr:ABC transporter substrate-binding protein [Pseudomonadota bacterium]
MRSLFRRLAAALMLGLSPQVGAATDLTIGIPTETTSIDPHYQDLGPNHQIRMHIFESLVLVGSKQEMLPGLATAWKVSDDPLIWEFTLRQGVRFHDGTPLTAADVVFSLVRALDVPNAPSTFKRYLEDMAEVVAVDDHTVRVRTKRLVPILPNSLAQISIVSAKRTRDVPSTSFNGGAAAIGTGPYKFVEFMPGSHVTFAANADYWGGAPPWSKVTLKLLSNAGSRLAALLAGDVDAIAEVPTTDIGRLARDGRVVLSQGPSNRVMFWAMDVSREKTPFLTARDGQEIANPLRDRRVREAISLVIDRRGIVDRVMEGLAIVTNQIAPEGFSGYTADIGIPPVDLQRARALMAEAGHANGFKLAIHSTNNRYINDAKAAQAVAQMLARLNIDVTVNAMPVALYFGAARKKEFTFLQVGWGHSTGDSYVVLREALKTDSLNNYGGWSNPEFDRLLDRANQEMDLRQRNQMLSAASKLAMADIAVIPTHDQVNVWASRKGLAFVPRMDELTLATSVAPQ